MGVLFDPEPERLDAPPSKLMDAPPSKLSSDGGASSLSMPVMKTAKGVCDRLRVWLAYGSKVLGRQRLLFWFVVVFYISQPT